MSYFAELGLSREPFSTSPDPAFFFRSTAHREALERLEIALRLRRGLCLVLGDVGAGKTTLARTLIGRLQHEEQILLQLIMDPWYETDFQFLQSLCGLFEVRPAAKSALDCREAIEHYLFQKGVTEGKTIVLLIDEGQKLSTGMLEHLRVLLNYETNEYKLLQVVIFAQMELLPRLQQMHNFLDRAALKYIVPPLDEHETAALIQFRLTTAGLRDGAALFEPEALTLIHRATQGYPRRVAMLCHQALEALVMHGLSTVNAAVVHTLVAHESRWIEPSVA